MRFEKAGGGLPEKERLFIRVFLVPLVRVLMNWTIARVLIKREVKIINNLVKNISTEKLQQKMAIDRTFAIEDNSRQFSINEVLEHLVIAGSLVRNVIETLSQEKDVEFDIKIEDVKPKENKQNQIKEFLEFYNKYDSFIKYLPKKQSKKTKAHPWFVRFNNFDWNIFMFMHTFIHRRQIEAILDIQNNKKRFLSNALKTIFIAGLLLITILLSWFLIISTAYIIIIFLTNIEFNFQVLLSIFITYLVLRAFYPKNVFM